MPSTGTPRLENFRIAARGIVGVDTARSAGKDNAPVVAGPDPVHRNAIGQHFAEDIVFADAAGDQLVVLAAEVEYQDGFMLQRLNLLEFEH